MITDDKAKTNKCIVPIHSIQLQEQKKMQEGQILVLDTQDLLNNIQNISEQKIIYCYHPAFNKYSTIYLCTRGSSISILDLESTSTSS